MIQLEQKEIKDLKEKWHNEQDNICPILQLPFPLESMTLDHLHKLKSELPDETGKGLCRGTIQFQANMFEGKILSDYKRCGLEKMIDLPSFLRNLALYLENNKVQEKELYIHPSEKPKKPKLMKSSYNKLKKLIDGKYKLPKYTGNLTKPLIELYKKYNLEPTFKK